MNIFTRGDDGADEFKLYHYDPTVAGAVIFTILFLATTLLHSWQLVRGRSWFVIPMTIGGFRKFLCFLNRTTESNILPLLQVEVIGYAARAKSGNESPNWTLGPYIIQSIFLLVAPALYAATIYMELGRIILMIDGEGRVLIPKKWMTKIFVTGDVLSFILQGGGGGYQASGTIQSLKTGAKIIIGGLFVQLIFFGVFIITAIAFHRAISANPTARSSSGLPWQKHMLTLYIGSFLIMVRSLFRAIEYLQGFDGYVLRHEAFLYIFDACLMFSVMVLFNWFHPSEITEILNGRGAGKSYSMHAFTEV
ncbi:RTM1 [Fusarium agapanthi]|uniref:RTM1 n=1 Tax=Fusarium agapanthi TaxID=1803897 RepID=A0A9P5BDY0_9HYPO|nr:RTM1 [Fusarium agapanthi]